MILLLILKLIGVSVKTLNSLDKGCYTQDMSHIKVHELFISLFNIDYCFYKVITSFNS